MNRLTEHFFGLSTGVFTQSDTEVLDGTMFSRHGLIKRAISKGEILNIRRGLYCLAPRYQKRPVNIYALSQRIYGPSYVSPETALRYHEWIPEAVYACTCASLGNAKEFNTPMGIFSYKRILQQVFYTGVERIVDNDGNAFFMASPAKALADYVYAHRPNWKSMDEAAGSLRIEPDDLVTVTQDEIALLLKNYSNKRVRNFLLIWRETLTS